MANLDLIPKLPVLAVQAGIFVANLGIMKKLFMEPYLKVRDAQDRLTIGSQGDATRFEHEAEAISTDVNQRLVAAMEAARHSREADRAKALSTRQQLLDEAQAFGQGELNRVEGEIRRELESERSKVPAIVASLADEVYKVALT
jgi:F0F1-type ATP synthase membrane subunit b/b'